MGGNPTTLTGDDTGPATAMLEVRGLRVRYGDHVAVDGLDLDAADGEVVCLLGPSGCGKSTVLRAIAGLQPQEAGTIRLAGASLDGLRPDQRRVGLMFQDHALFPHRSVADNVAFGPRMQGLERSEVDGRVRAALELVELAGAERRPVTELSGGEQQRVALARAIAPRPRLLMLDEPLGSLDRALRDRLLRDLPPLLRGLGTTVLYVTHDQDEALTLADRVAVMRAGRLVQVGTPTDLWRSPRSEFVARFLGLDQIVDATVEGTPADRVAHTVLGTIPLPPATAGSPTGDVSTPGPTASTSLGDAPTGTDVPGIPLGGWRLVLLPDALRIAATGEPSGGELAVAGVVVQQRFAADHVVVEVDTEAGVHLRVPVWRGSAPPVGARVVLALDPAATRLVPADT